MVQAKDGDVRRLARHVFGPVGHVSSGFEVDAVIPYFWGQISLQLVSFFLTALVCHQALAIRRPPPERLTEFYLLMSLGYDVAVLVWSIYFLSPRRKADREIGLPNTDLVIVGSCTVQTTTPFSAQTWA